MAMFVLLSLFTDKKLIKVEDHPRSIGHHVSYHNEHQDQCHSGFFKSRSQGATEVRNTACCGCGWGCCWELVSPWREFAQLQVVVSCVVNVVAGRQTLVHLASLIRLVNTPVQVNQGSHWDDSSDEHPLNRNHDIMKEICNNYRHVVYIQSMSEKINKSGM